GGGGGCLVGGGALKQKNATRHARSDWMEIEKQRGISVTTSVMKFMYSGVEITLLDTPGHEDFSEDTYRVLTAVDSVLMVIDGAKGVEAQTRKLFEICRLRDIPIITFVNKYDREALPPLEILENIENELALECAPVTWPVGMGKTFRGVYHLRESSLHLFSATHQGKINEGVRIKGLDDPLLDTHLNDFAAELRDDVELISGASVPFDTDEYLSGAQTPVFFGSGVNNFGVKELIDTFLQIAPGPGTRKAKTRDVDPFEENFSGFVFKIQANMDPSHRDRIAFLRVCSGKYTKGMKLTHVRINKKIATKNAMTFLAQERAVAEEAFPGDIIGIPNHGTIKIGDTFTEGEELRFLGIPNFAPEYFRRIRLLDPLKAKSLIAGLKQLAEEGTLQLFQKFNSADYIIGVVGVLQFEVIVGRLRAEYKVEGRVEPTTYNKARWVETEDKKSFDEFKSRHVHDLALDAEGHTTFLATSQWHIDKAEKEWPKITFLSHIEHS
ncbi:MAG: peptide chain release factor 3, partial [Nitrospinota bacterium]